MMYVLMGYTRGDELISSSAHPMFAAPARDQVERELARVHKERERWFAINTVPPHVECSVFCRFEIIEVPGEVT
jgi:hypothetical protein